MRLVVQPTPEEADKDIAASAQLGQTNSPARGAEHRQPEMLDGEAPMNIRRLLFAALIVTCWAGVALAQDLAVFAKPEQLGFSPDRLKRITDAYQGYVDRGELPGAVMVIARNGKIAYAEAIGFQDREKKTAMKKDAIFRLASMTKPIVSVAAMMLVEEGKLDLLAPVSKYLPELKDVKVGFEEIDPTSGRPNLRLETPHRPMTVQDLMRHTAGFVYGQFGERLVHQAYRDAKVSDRDQSLAEMVTKLSKLPLAHHPGEVWEYSVSVDVLGRVIEVVSGMELDRFVAEFITKPLGMAATDFYVHEQDHGRLAEAQPGADGKPATLPDVRQKPRLLSGGGGMVASASDYLRFCEMLLNGGEAGDLRILSPHTVRLMTNDALPPNISYTERSVRQNGDITPMPQMGQGFGLGFAVRTAPGHNPLPGSVGTFYWTGAWGTTFWIDPQEKLIAVQMIQVPLAEGPAYRRAFRNLTYQALTGS
jgi:CubicO group peptidase (beta-lactamase class C family)